MDGATPHVLISTSLFLHDMPPTWNAFFFGGMVSLRDPLKGWNGEVTISSRDQVGSRLIEMSSEDVPLPR